MRIGQSCVQSRLCNRNQARCRDYFCYGDATRCRALFAMLPGDFWPAGLVLRFPCWSQRQTSVSGPLPRRTRVEPHFAFGLWWAMGGWDVPSLGDTPLGCGELVLLLFLIRIIPCRGRFSGAARTIYALCFAFAFGNILYFPCRDAILYVLLLRDLSWVSHRRAVHTPLFATRPLRNAWYQLRPLFFPARARFWKSDSGPEFFNFAPRVWCDDSYGAAHSRIYSDQKLF